MRYVAQFWTGFNSDALETHVGDPILPSPVGEKHAFRALYSTGCACIQGSVDGNVLWQSLFNPYSELTGGLSLGAHSSWRRVYICLLRSQARQRCRWPSRLWALRGIAMTWLSPCRAS